MKKLFSQGIFCLFLIFGFHFCYSQEVKVDTVFVGNASNSKVNKFIKKQATVFIIVRHGEKENNGKNPHLSEAGKNRAIDLAELLKNSKIDNAYSTDYFRTKETIEHLVSDKKLEVKIYNPSKISDFVKNELVFNQSKSIISGHSNTNPLLLNEICKVNFYKDIPDAKFNDMYIVNVFKKRKRIKVFHLLY